MVVRRIHLTFPEEQVSEPVVWAVGHKFQVVTNIRRANISDGTGWMAIDLEGEEEEIQGAIEYLRARGIGVEIMDETAGSEGSEPR